VKKKVLLSMVRRLSVGVLAMVLLAACSTPDPMTSAEYTALVSERDSISAELEKATSDLQKAKEAEEEVRSKLEETAGALEAADAEVQSAVAQVASLTAERDAAVAEAESLRLKYDPEIRAGLQAEWDAELFRACGEAVANLDASIASLVSFSDAWSSIGTEADLTAAVESCAAPERSKSVEQREAERLASFETINVDQVVRDPNAYQDRGVVVFARIVQFDVNTGSCAFHAEMSASKSTRWFDYDERAQFGFGTDEITQILETACPSLDNIDQDDFVKIWAVGAGSFSYDTSMGGTNTVPLFAIEKIELVQKD
jgi:hypothetical protein